METKSGSSAETLKRIQNETQRVKQRIRNDSERKRPEPRQQHVDNNHSIEVSAPNKVHDNAVESPRETRTLVIEKSSRSFFKDPVPANHMSSHLKSEHEAFKARYVSCVIKDVFFLLRRLLTPCVAAD
jgi:hypothetical protein